MQEENGNQRFDIHKAINGVAHDLQENLKMLGLERDVSGPLIITLEDFLKIKIPPRDQIIAPVLNSQGLAMIYADRGVGKTYFVMSLGYAIACGGQCFQWTARKARRVLYVEGELPGYLLQERFVRIINAAPTEPPEKEYFYLYPNDLQEFSVMPNIAEREGQKQIERHLENIEVLILDSLSTLCRSGEENSAESWLPIQDWILGLRRKGIAVIMIHHAGKNGSQRGTSKREDILDTVISLKHPPDYDQSQGARFEVHFTKSRNYHGDLIKPFEAWLMEERGAVYWGLKDLTDRETEQALSLSRDKLTQREIAQELGIPQSRVCRLLRRAAEKGLV